MSMYLLTGIFVLDFDCFFVLVRLLVVFMGIVVLCTVAVFWLFFPPWV